MELKKEQEEAIFYDGGDIIVSASAGSGKTYVMIERIIRLIREGKAKVREILATTFTDAAAQEIRDRLKKELAQNVEEGRGDLAEELADIYVADICTLHSFCSRLIRTYFFVSGIAPDFKILEESNADELKADAMEQTFKEFYDSREQWFINFTARYKSGRRDDELKKIILLAYTFMESEQSTEDFINKSIEVYEKDRYKEIIDEYEKRFFKELADIKSDVQRALVGFTRNGYKAGIDFATELYDIICNIENNGSMYAIKSAMSKPDSRRVGKAKEENREYKIIAVAARGRLVELIERYDKHLTTKEEDERRCAIIQDNTKNFFTVLNRFSEVYTEKKMAEDSLDFADLERYALKTLADPQVQEEVKKKYKYVFIDEYQDINGVQEKIISTITNDNAFMVGDVKQSIYGWRGCRPEFFEERLHTIEGRGGKAILLNHNFRSADAVINAINKIFAYSMTDKYFADNYKDTAMLQSGGIYINGGKGRAELHFLEKEKAKKDAEIPQIYDILDEIKKTKEEDQPDVSALVENIIHGELEKKYYAPKEKIFKRVTFADIVILSRAKDNAFVQSLVEGLTKRGVPISSEVSQSICDFPETAILINALKLIYSFTDDLSLVSVLKSHIGGFTEEDLSKIALFYADNCKERKRGGFCAAFAYYMTNADTPLKERAKAFYEYFKKLTFLADYLGAGRILTKIVNDCGYDNYLLADVGGERKVRRIKRLISLAEDQSKNYTVSEFLRRAELNGKEFNIIESGDDNAVRVMTIHSSKGLEFPVVIVCGLERNMNNDSLKREIYFDRTYGIATKYYDDKERIYSETPLRGLIQENFYDNQIREELRLFYVATTRAAYSLHLVFEAKEDKRTDDDFGTAKKFIDYVPNDMPKTQWNSSDFGAINILKEPRKIIIGEKDNNIVERIKKNFAYQYEFIEDCNLPLKISVTTAGKMSIADTDTEDTSINVIDDSVTVLQSEEETFDKTDARRGIIAHKVLEKFDFNRIAEFDKQIEEMLQNGDLTKNDIAEISTERIKKALYSNAFKKIQGATLYREKSFIAKIGANCVLSTTSKEDVLLQGIIDLLAIKGEEIFIIDYKYSRANAETLAKRYKKQLDLYAQTASNILYKKVGYKALVNLFNGEVIEFV